MNLKDNIEKILNKQKVAYRFISLPEDLPSDVPSHAAFHGIKMANAMATILYRTEKGIIGATKRADTQIDQEKLKQLVGVKELNFAAKEDLKKLGTEVGLVPYLGLKIPYFVDQKVLEIDQVYGTGGEKLFGMAMNSRDMVKVNGGTVADFTYFKEEKVFASKRLLSGITPSGDGSLHIGNYLGAVKQFIELAKTTECFLMVADLHALTTIQDQKTLQRNTEILILNELALLGDLKNITFFRQSDVPLHAELQSILNNVTPLGLLKRAHAYKDKLTKDVMEDEINLGLFNYPILMAADILLYKPDLVPVGKDQKQHVEITRDIAQRFNKVFKNNQSNQKDKSVFVLPEAYIPEEVAAIMGTDGKRKMSKSLGNIISIFESEEIIRKQVHSTFTDPLRAHATDPGHIEGNMVFTYLEFFGDKRKFEDLKGLYKEGKVADVEVKEYLFDSLMKVFAPARARYAELKESPAKVKAILEQGAAKAREVATKTMTEVRDAVGLTNSYSFFSYENFVRPGLVETSSTGSGGKAEAFNTISIDQLAAVELRVGKVVEATHPEKSEKLIRLVVDFGLDLPQRVIFTGVRPYGYIKDDFIGKQFFFVTNLAPRRMIGEESQGMILAVDGEELPFGKHGEKRPMFISAEGMPIGAKIR